MTDKLDVRSLVRLSPFIFHCSYSEQAINGILFSGEFFDGFFIDSHERVSRPLVFDCGGNGGLTLVSCILSLNLVKLRYRERTAYPFKLFLEFFVSRFDVEREL